MAGTKTSNRCDNCRQRKVKCDEAWPTCGSCSKSRRLCPGPPRKILRWVETRDVHPSPSSLECNSGRELGWAQHGPQNRLRMVTLRSKKLENGDQMHKIRLVQVRKDDPSCQQHTSERLSWRSPPMSFDEEICYRSRAVLDPHDVSMLSHGILVRSLLGRFGTSAALDDAVICLLASHEAILRGADVSAWLDTKGYGRALRSIQTAINDPDQQFSTETLASVAMLWKLEGVISRASRRRGIHTQTIHGNAMAEMLLRRGIRKPDDELELHLAIDCFLADVQVRSVTPVPSRFDTPEWDAAISRLKGPTFLEEVYVRVFQTWIKWPALVQDIAYLQLECVPSGTPTPKQIMHRLLALASQLDALSSTIGSLLDDEHMCCTGPSMADDPLVPEVYWFKVPFLPIVVAAHAYYTIPVYQMIIFVNSFIPAPGFASPTFFPSAPPLQEEQSFFAYGFGTFPLPSSIIAGLRHEILVLSRRVWMICEQARNWRPLRCQMLINALKATYPWAGTPEMEQWILDAGKNLDSFPLSAYDWEPWSLEFLSKAYTGDLSNMKLVQKDDGLPGVARRLRKTWNAD